MPRRVDVVDRIVARISIAVLRQAVCQHSRKRILCDETAILGRIVACAEILQARERVLLLAVVAVERGLDAVLIGVDVAIRVVGVDKGTVLMSYLI